MGPYGFLWVLMGPYGVSMGPNGALWVRQWDGTVRLWDFGAEAESPCDDVTEVARGRSGKRSGAG